MYGSGVVVSTPRKVMNMKNSIDRVLRGGCWYLEVPSDLRSANRDRYDPSNRVDLLGFRVVDIDKNRVIRGGSWFNDNPNYLRSAFRYRFDPSVRNYNLGFRVVKV